MFGALNFTHIDNNWSTHFNACLFDSTLAIYNLVIPRNGKLPLLLSTQCWKYDNKASEVDPCDCDMDCLMVFELNYYIYIEGINCNETTFNNSLIIFKRSENLRSNFALKNNYPNCSNTPGIISNHLQQGSHYNYFSLTAPSSTSTLITQMETTTVILTTHKPNPFTSITFTSSPIPVPTS